MSDADHNPFNGLTRSPTNDELVFQWNRGLSVAPIVFLWLLLEALLMDSLWAGWAFEHGVIAWSCLAILTWWRPVLACLLTLLIAVAAAVKAFSSVCGEAWGLSSALRD